PRSVPEVESTSATTDSGGSSAGDGVPPGFSIMMWDPLRPIGGARGCAVRGGRCAARSPGAGRRRQWNSKLLHATTMDGSRAARGGFAAAVARLCPPQLPVVGMDRRTFRVRADYGLGCPGLPDAGVRYRATITSRIEPTCSSAVRGPGEGGSPAYPV